MSCGAALGLGAASIGCASFEADDEVAAAEAAAGLESSGQVLAIAPCLSASDYVPRGVVQFGSAGAYKQPCTRLATGGTVVFQGPLSLHPLVPRPIGSQPSPIEYTAWGGSVEFEFPDYGFFAYQCGLHPEEIGVVWASWAF